MDDHEHVRHGVTMLIAGQSEFQIVAEADISGLEVSRRVIERHPDTRVLVFSSFPEDRFAELAVCNRHHSVDQQLCRWLLLSLDRLDSNQLTMTQDLIANMLGVRREGVTESAGRLQRLGVIRYSRGSITVLDRPHLEQLCCECYDVVKRETDRLQALAMNRHP